MDMDNKGNKDNKENRKDENIIKETTKDDKSNNVKTSEIKENSNTSKAQTSEIKETDNTSKAQTSEINKNPKIDNTDKTVDKVKKNDKTDSTININKIDNDKIDSGGNKAKASQVVENKNAGNKKNIIIIAIAAIIFILLIVYGLMSNYYTKHFYNNTSINGLDASNNTVQQTKDDINNELKDYALTLSGRDDITEVINGYSIEINTEFDDSIDKLLERQKGYDWPKHFFGNRDLKINTMITFDEDLLNLIFDNMAFFDEEIVVEPVDAHVGDYDGTRYKIVPEVYGNQVKREVLYNVTTEAINNLESDLSLEEADCYEVPEIKEDNPELIQLTEDLNTLTSAKITYEFGEATEIVDGNRISEWLLVDEDNQVSLDEEKVEEFVDYIGGTYNTFGKTRTLKTTYGPTIEIQGGDYGWWLNRGKETQELADLIKSGAQTTKEPAYLQKAAHYGADDVGDTYVEVNLTAQHLFFYKDGALVVESDFVSGNTSRNHNNPTGTFPVQYKERNAILRGENYASPVDYWMPFNGDIGFHDAKWRSEFGGTIYKTGGSHGCINLPLSAAAKMFENIERGVGVYVYKLEGTETNQTSTVQ